MKYYYRIVYKVVLLLVAMLSSCFVYAQIDSLLGNWRTVDDSTDEIRSMVRIYKGPDNLYYGKIEKMYKYADAVCDKCEDENKNKPVLGLIIITGMKAEGNVLKGGYVLDPENGKKYFATISFDKSSGKLKLRGSLDKRGFLGRNQYWIR
jgi:uncharacterized protein (DUF2147 family)